MLLCINQAKILCLSCLSRRGNFLTKYFIVFIRFWRVVLNLKINFFPFLSFYVGLLRIP